MADRYQDRPFPSDGFGRGADPRVDADPLAELARLIGQTETPAGRGAPQVAPRAAAARQPVPPIEPHPSIPPGPPSWMQRANRQEIPRSQQQVPASARDPFAEMPREPQRAAAPGYPATGFTGAPHGHDDLGQDFDGQDFDSQTPPHPGVAQQSQPRQDFSDQLAKLDFSVGESRHRFAEAEADPHFDRDPAFEEQDGGDDRSRYDEALYGQLGPAQQDYQEGEQDDQDEHFGYQDGYDEADEEDAPKRRGGKAMVLAIVALGFLGTGGAFAYRSYFSGARGGEPPIIKADNSPTKIMASPADTTPKVPDRLLGGDGGEKLVSREEAPVDLSRSVGGNGNNGGPRVVFPQPGQNGNSPSPTSVAPTALASAAPSVNNGTMPNGDPRPIKTFSVSGNQADAGAPASAQPPATKPAKVIAAQAVLPRNSAVNANASASNAPMAITPQQAPASRVAALDATEQPAAAAASGGYLVSISSQNSEAEAISSYEAVQAKYSSVLGSYSPVIKRVEPNGRVMYRAAVGPFATRDAANKMCGTLKTAGGQCFTFSN
jgi:SPOR domain